MKFNKGDYIRYTKENEQQVIDGLMVLGYSVYNHSNLNSENFNVFVLQPLLSCFGNENMRFQRKLRGSSLLTKDKTFYFFDYLNKVKLNEFREPIEKKELPSKFYIDCGDRIEVREWLDGMGFMWSSGGGLLSHLTGNKHIWSDNETKVCYSAVSFDWHYTLIKPKLTVTSFEVERTESDNDERNKELEELKRLHDEIGERLDALLSR